MQSQDIFEGESPIFSNMHPNGPMFRRLLGVREIGKNFYECASTCDNRALLRSHGVAWFSAILNNGENQNSAVLKFVL